MMIGAGLTIVGITLDGPLPLLASMLGVLLVGIGTGATAGFWRGVAWDNTRWMRQVAAHNAEGLESMLADAPDHLPDEIRAGMQRALRQAQEQLADLGEDK